MTDMEKRTAAARLAADWKDRGDEKQETQRFWIELLTKASLENWEVNVWQNRLIPIK